MCLMIFIRVCFIFLFRSAASSAASRDHSHRTRKAVGVCGTQNARTVRARNSGMNKTTDTNKLTKLHELDSLLPREIRGQSQVAAAHRLGGSARRTRPHQTRPSARKFSAARPNGRRQNGNGGCDDEPDFRARDNCSASTCREFQNQEALGLLLGARLGEVGYLGRGARARGGRFTAV